MILTNEDKAFAFANKNADKYINDEDLLGALRDGFLCGALWKEEQMKSPWHKVTDGDLPKVDKYQKCIKVFVRKGNDVYVAFFSPIAGFSLSSSFYTEYMLNDIDYWMEIPEIQEEQK